jgi:hypothetical protein
LLRAALRSRSRSSATSKIQANTDRFDVTAYGDTGKAFVAGLPDASGTYSGFFDDSTAQMYTAGSDGSHGSSTSTRTRRT